MHGVKGHTDRAQTLNQRMLLQQADVSQVVLNDNIINSGHNELDLLCIGCTSEVSVDLLCVGLIERNKSVQDI